MNNTATHIERIETPGAQQLTLLSVPESPDLKNSSAHARFKLSKVTRTRGLAHVAEIRRQLAESQAKNTGRTANPLPPRHTHAA